MNLIERIYRHVLAGVALACISIGGLNAQGPPSPIMDSCLVSSTLRFKTLPMPHDFMPGTIEALRNCPNLGNCVVRIPSAKVGKARGLVMMLRIEGGRLREVHATAKSEKAFEKLYQSMVDKAGTPSKLVESNGVLRYSWEMRDKVKDKVEILQNPVSKHGTVIVKE